MKFYVTKYALSGGIFVIESEEQNGCVRDTRPGSFSWHSFGAGTEAFANEAEAICDAEKRREKKIASLEKQIIKLRNTRFVKP